MTGALLLDVGLVAALAGAAIAGVRSGAWSRLFGWVGVGVALAVGARFLPGMVTTFGGTGADGRVTVAVLYLVVLAVSGHAVGTVIAAARSRQGAAGLEGGHVPAQASPPARVLGGLCGLAGVVVLVWMLTPAVAAVPGWPARAMRDSVVVGAIDRWMPRQPSSFAEWGRLVAEAPYPSALDPLAKPPRAGPPPANGLRPALRRRVERSLVRVSGVACDRTQDGSGFVVARADGDGVLVVTNAHVVAGETGVETISVDGSRRDARLVLFDPKADVAVLEVPGLEASALPLASQVERGTAGSVLGFPGGGGLEESPASVARLIRAVGTDIYRRDRSTRSVLVLAARLAPGDSGAPFVTRAGMVAGMAFAIDPGRKATAYALTVAEIRRAIERAGSATVSSGRCVKE